MPRAFIIHQTFFYNPTLPLIGRNFTRVVNAQQKLFPPYTNTLSIDTSLQSLNIKMYVVSKLNKQHEQTWINLQKRLNSVQFPSITLLCLDVLGPSMLFNVLYHLHPPNAYTVPV